MKKVVYHGIRDIRVEDKPEANPGRVGFFREDWTVPALLDGVEPLAAGRTLAWRALRTARIFLFNGKPLTAEIIKVKYRRSCIAAPSGRHLFIATMRYLLYVQRSFAAWSSPNSISFSFFGLPLSQSQLLTS